MLTTYQSSIRPYDGPKTQLPKKIGHMLNRDTLAFSIPRRWPEITPYATRWLLAFLHASKTPDLSRAAYMLIGATHPWQGPVADTTRRALAQYIRRGPK